MFWYTIGRINKMCFGMSTGAVWWLAYEWLRKIILKIMHCNNVDFLDLPAILIIILLISIYNFCFKYKWHLLVILIKQIYNYSKNNFIYRKKIILSHSILYVVRSETVLTFYLG